MTTPGQTYSTLINEVWTPELVNTIFFNDWLFNGSVFPIVQSPGGSTISSGYEYAVTTSTGTYNYDDPMVSAMNTSQVRAYFNKDFFQEAVRVFKQYLDYAKNGGTEAELDIIRRSLEVGIKNLKDIAVTTMLADLEAQVDSSTAYSDASLSRTTYATLKSYEETTSTALTLAHLEDAIEAIMTHTTYGSTVRDEKDLLIMMPRNQLTNLSRLVTGAAYNSSFFNFNTSTQDMGPADAGRVFRTKSFEGIDIVSVPDMTTTSVLILHKPDVKIYENRPVTVTEKPELADTMLWQLTCGYNAVCHAPGNSAKLSGKTA